VSFPCHGAYRAVLIGLKKACIAVALLMVAVKSAAGFVLQIKMRFRDICIAIRYLS
jgi:hypothetical protein